MVEKTDMGQAALDNVKRKHVIFTVTTGRSGTAYLASIFGYARGVTALHEPAPEFAEVLRDVQRDRSLAKKFLLERKLPEIARAPSATYIETSHLTCKGFLEPLLELGIVPDLIVHRRANRDIALSLFKMGTIPGRSDKGLKFYLSPDDPEVLRIRDWEALSDYQVCFWYCLEIERRAQHYKQLYARNGGRIVETTLTGLKTFEGLRVCFGGLGLEAKRPYWLTRLRFSRSSRVRVNESRETKKTVEIPDNLDELEAEVWRRIDREQLTAYVPEAVEVG